MITFISRNETFDINDAFTLDCQAEGVPPPKFRWTKEGDSTFVRTSASFQVTNVQAKDKGNYLCTVENTDGVNTKFVTILVRRKYMYCMQQFYCFSLFFMLIFIPKPNFLVIIKDS